MAANGSASTDLPRQKSAEEGTAAGISPHPPHAHHSSPGLSERNRSFAHLTSVSATLAIRELDAALLSPPRSRAAGGIPVLASSRGAADTSNSSGSGSGSVSQGPDGTTTTQIRRVSDVADPTRVAAERAVLQERFDRRQRVHPRVFQQLTTKRTPSANKLLSKRARLDPSLKSSGGQSTKGEEKGSASIKSDEEVYAPFSLPLLLRRLATFTLGNYSLYKKVKLPGTLDDGSLSGTAQARQRRAAWREWVEEELNPVRCARLGWYVLSPSSNTVGERPKGREKLRCGACQQIWSVEDWVAQEAASAYQGHVQAQEEAAKVGFTGDALIGSARREEVGVLKKMHRDWCPWIVKYCEPSLYSIPTQSRPGLLRELLITTKRFSESFNSLAKIPGSNSEGAIQCSSPVSEEQLEALLRAMEEEERRIARAAAIASGLADEDIRNPAEFREEGAGILQQESVKNAALLSLCGWDLVALGSSASAEQPIRADQLAIECSMCTRKVGLWSFRTTNSTAISQNAKPLDVIKEHRDFCAFVTPYCAPRSAPTSVIQDASGKTPLPGWQLRLQIALGKALDNDASGSQVCETGSASGRDGVGLAEGGDGSLRNVGVAQLLKRMRDVLDG